MRGGGPRRWAAPGGRPVGGPILAAGLGLGLLAGTASAAHVASAAPAAHATPAATAASGLSAGAPQGAADTAWTEPPGGASPRAVVAPDSARLDSMVAEVASKLRCPVCRNQSVLESTASLSRQMQSVIREKLAAGESPEAIEAYFVDKYGEWILLRPEAEGIGLLVYVLPAVALLAGIVLVVAVLRRWSRPAPGGGRSGAGGAPEDAGPDDAAPEDTGLEDTGLEGLPPEERRWIRRQIGSA